jgi:diaminohydroxyphosphoribosylaminopyrimidine deaminase/5-amino-6-(5-phosphoribosylamino)uracil reductase
LLDALSARGFNQVLWECGPELAAAALLQNCIQEVAAVISPRLLGGLAARTPIGDMGLERVDQSHLLKHCGMTMIENDLLWELRTSVDPQ